MKKFLLTFSVIFFAFVQTLYAQLMPSEAAVLMQKGINLGNTLEPPLEGDWGNPPAQEYYFDMYKAAGFQCVRIPVRWDKHTQDTFPYQVDEAWMNRVEQVADWGLARGLFIVINAHHEEWIKQNYTNAAYRARFDSIWAQVSRRFKDKSDHLLFEIINEPYGLTKAQNDELHQRVLGIIRKTNPTRIVIFQGHNWGGSDELIQAAIPNDPYVMGSFHSYDPYTFGLLGQGTWGTASDIAALNSKFTAVKNWSVANHIPVFLGEFGAIKTCDYNSRMKDYKTYVELAQKNGFVYCAWDDGGDFRIMERQAHGWNEIKDILVNSTVNSPANPQAWVYQDTLIQLSWTNPKSDYDSIYILRKNELTDFVMVAKMKGDTSRFTDFHLSQNHTYYYRVIAHYKTAPDLYSYPVKVFLPKYVVKVRQPYLGSPVNLPGTIEAENFDFGGEGVAYHDADPLNIGTAYRPTEGVDIYSMNGNGYEVGNFVTGEWDEYTVNIAQAGQYAIDARVAALVAGGTFKISIDSAETGILTVPSTGSFLTTKAVTANLNLPAGQQVMRFTVLSVPNAFYVDKFDISQVTSAPVLPAAENWKVYLDASRNIVLDLGQGTPVKTVRLFRMDGSLMLTLQDPGQFRLINTSGYSSGLYIVQLTGNNNRVTRKVMIP